MSKASVLDRLVSRGKRLVQAPDYGRGDDICRLPPKVLVLVVNNFCNLKCRMCDVGTGDEDTVFFKHLIGEKPVNMSTGLLQRLIDSATDFSPRPAFGMGFTEPLLHKGIIGICEKIRDAGFEFTITTNGYLLPRHAEQLVDVGLDEITLSVDGPEDVHDRVRGRSGSFRRMFEGARKLVDYRDRLGRAGPRLNFSYTITDINYTHMAAFTESIASLSPNRLIFSHLNFISDQIALEHNRRFDNEWAVTRSNLGAMDIEALDLQAMDRALRDLKSTAGSLLESAALHIVPDMKSVAELDTYYNSHLDFIGGRNCTDPWSMMMVRTDGDVIPAHGRCYDVPVGNVFETELVDIWNGDKMRAFRKTLRTNGGTLPACARCCGVIGKPKSA